MQDTKHKVKALDKGNCAVARPGGKEAGVKTMSPRTETGYEAGDADELVPHNEVQGSASQVKSGVVLRKFTSLPGETCPASGLARKCGADTDRGNTGGERTGVSRGRSSAGYEPAVGVHLPWGALKVPDGLTLARRTELIRTAETATTCQLPSWCGRVRRRKTAVFEGIGSDRLLLPPNRRRQLRKYRRTLKMKW
jgi:hypothetical protein